MKLKHWMMVVVPVLLVFGLMAFVPRLLSSKWFFFVAIAAIFGGLIFALAGHSKDHHD
jgi:hypothetical protein